MQIPSGQREIKSVVKFFPRNPRIVELGEYQKKLARAPVMEEPPVAIQVGEMALRSQSNENVINMLDKLGKMGGTHSRKKNKGKGEEVEVEKVAEGELEVEVEEVAQGGVAEDGWMNDDDGWMNGVAPAVTVPDPTLSLTSPHFLHQLERMKKDFVAKFSPPSSVEDPTQRCISCKIPTSYLVHSSMMLSPAKSHRHECIVSHFCKF